MEAHAPRANCRPDDPRAGDVALTLDVRVFIAGDIKAFERLVDRTKNAITSMALAIVRDPVVSEEVAQDVYVQLWRDLGSLKNPESFLPWLRQMTRNRAYMTLRGERRRDARRSVLDEGTEVASGEPGIVDRALDEEERRVLFEALEALPDETRDVLTLFYREDSSVKQVAELLGISTDAVKKRLERARVALRSDVAARFEELVKRTAPAATFTAAVISVVTFAVPATATAATSIAMTVAKGTLGTLLAPFAGLALGVGSGVLGYHVGHRRLERNALDGEERRLLRAAGRGMIAMAAYVVLMLGSGSFAFMLPKVAVAAMHVAAFAVFFVLLQWFYLGKVREARARRYAMELAIHLDGPRTASQGVTSPTRRLDLLRRDGARRPGFRDLASVRGALRATRGTREASPSTRSPPVAPSAGADHPFAFRFGPNFLASRRNSAFEIGAWGRCAYGFFFARRIHLPSEKVRLDDGSVFVGDARVHAVEDEVEDGSVKKSRAITIIMRVWVASMGTHATSIIRSLPGIGMWRFIWFGHRSQGTRLVLAIDANARVCAPRPWFPFDVET